MRSPMTTANPRAMSVPPRAIRKRVRKSRSRVTTTAEVGVETTTAPMADCWLSACLIGCAATYWPPITRLTGWLLASTAAPIALRLRTGGNRPAMARTLL